MEHFFTTIPGIIMGVGAVIVGSIVGIGYIVGVWKGKKDDADDRLINLLKEIVEELERKVDNQKKESDETVCNLTKKIDNLTIKVNELEKENSTLIEVLQGRDKNTLDFQRQMLEAMKIGMETNGLAKHTAEKLTELMSMMGEHIKAVETLQDKKQ